MNWGFKSKFICTVLGFSLSVVAADFSNDFGNEQTLYGSLKTADAAVTLDTTGYAITGCTVKNGAGDGQAAIVDIDASPSQLAFSTVEPNKSGKSVFADNVVQTIPPTVYTVDSDTSVVPPELMTNGGVVLSLTTTDVFLTALSFDYQKIGARYYRVAVLYSDDNESTWKVLTAPIVKNVGNTSNNQPQNYTYSGGAVSGVDAIRILIYSQNSNDAGTGYIIDNISFTTATLDVVDDFYKTPKGDTLLVDAANGVLQNDSFSGETITPVTGGATTAGGSYDLAADGSFSYTPPANFLGLDTFNYSLGAENGTVHISSQGILAQYDFDESQPLGDTLIDSTGNFNGTIGDKVVSLSGKPSAFLGFSHDFSAVDASNNAHTIPAFNDYTNEFTLTAWIKVPQSTPGDYATIPFNGTNNSWSGIYGTHKAGDTGRTVTFSLRFVADDDSNYYYTPAIQYTNGYDNAFRTLDVGRYVAGADETQNEDKWLFIAFVVSPTSYKVYLSDNDEALQSESVGKVVDRMEFDAPGFIGWGTNKDVPFAGTIDRMRIYNKSLSDGEVEALYALDKDLSPVIGMEFEQTGNQVTWSVEDEIGVKEYRVVNSETNEIVATVQADGSGDYSLTIDEATSVKLVVVDHSGFEQTFYPTDGNSEVIAYDLVEGWNLITVVSDDADLKNLVNATTGDFWSWTGDSYEITDNPKPTEGIWVYAPQATQVTVSGQKATATMHLQPGWNLTGPIQNCLIPAGAEFIYSWDEMYKALAEDQETLIRGVGYWIYSF